MRLRFDTEEEALAYSAAEAMLRGCNMETTVYWYAVEQDEIGWYIEIEEQGNLVL